ncbi:MAG: hypothetical protein QG622_2289, partial [Actinomycetota bacterium]|nr:hypothetical protein [Actinomycetota bacterium]
FAKDAKPGDWKGQGVKSVWFVITKDGKRNLSCLPEGTVVRSGDKVAAHGGRKDYDGNYGRSSSGKY